MLRQGLLLFSSGLLVAMGIIHSYLGERYLLPRLLALPDLPLFRRDRKFTERVVRFAWHITSLGWLGFAALLVLLGTGNTSAIAITIAATLAIHGIFIVSTCGMRHPAWSLFLIAAAAILIAG